MATVSSYADINTYVGVNNKPVVLTGDDAVINGIINILLVPRRTRKFRANFGSWVSWFLHQPVHPANAVRLRNQLQAELNTWMPLTQFQLADIRVTPYRNGTGYHLSISFPSISGTDMKTVTLDLSVMG